MPKLRTNAQGKRVGRKGNPNKVGRPKNADVAKTVKLSPEELTAQAMKRRKEALEYGKKAGALPNQRLVVRPKAGYHLHWFKDDNTGRIDKALSLGYNFVQENQMGDFLPIPSDDIGSRKSVRSGEIYLYLMEIPEAIYLEDQQAKENRIRQTESQIRKGDGTGGGLASERSQQGGSVAYNPIRHGDNNLKV